MTASPPRVEVVRVLVAAVARVMRMSLGEQATLSGLEVSRCFDPPPSIAVSIELSGSLRGPLTCVFSPELAAQVAARLLMSDDVDPEFFPDAVAELANIVIGQATGPLSDAGFPVEIATPVVHPGIPPELATNTLVATLSSPSGTVKVFLGVEVAA